MSETPIPKKQLGELAERTSIDGKERFLTQGGLDADVVSQRKSARTRIQELEEEDGIA